MSGAARTSLPLRFLGIEGGATRTVAVLADAAGDQVARVEAGPGNVRLLSDAQLLRLLRDLRARLPDPAAVALGMAGAATEQDRQRIRAAAAQVWSGVPCVATHDLDTALAAAGLPARAEARPRRAPPADRRITPPCSAAPVPRVLVLSGTGSICYGRTPEGRTAKLGGWGHLLGDKGSGYDIGLRALKAVVDYHDREGTWPALGQRLLRALQLNEPTDLIGWAQQASKSDLAALAVEVFNAWHQRDTIAADIIATAAHGLADDAVACARRLLLDPAGEAFAREPTSSEPLPARVEAHPVTAPSRHPARARPEANQVEFILAGGVLRHQPSFARRVSRLIRQHWPAARVRTLEREGAWGAVELARGAFAAALPPGASEVGAGNARPSVSRSRRGATRRLDRVTASPPLVDLHESPTEQRLPRSARLDKLPLGEAVTLMLSEERRVPRALRAWRREIERAIRLIVRAFRRGGRLFYVGAGTSGRLGVLDASECPPTFSVPPEMVQAILAGGQRALWQASEGAEDDADAGARAIAFRGVCARDVVVGIAASGRTPFVWGALQAAKARGAATLLLCFNPRLRLTPGARPDLIIAPDVGPEVLTGSTRLKAGTATKIVLNLFTTLAMVRLGKVVSNLMVDLNPSNTKLRDRAVRIVRELTGRDAAAAQEALTRSGWLVKAALKRLKRGDRIRASDRPWKRQAAR